MWGRMSCISEATLPALETIHWAFPCAHSENKLDHILVLIKTLTVGHQKLHQKSGKYRRANSCPEQHFYKALGWCTLNTSSSLFVLKGLFLSEEADGVFKSPSGQKSLSQMKTDQSTATSIFFPVISHYLNYIHCPLKGICPIREWRLPTKRRQQWWWHLFLKHNEYSCCFVPHSLLLIVLRCKGRTQTKTSC